MVTQHDIDGLQRDLEALRARMQQGVVEAQGLGELAQRVAALLAAGRGGVFEPCLHSIAGLLGSLQRSLVQQEQLQALRRAA
jgi:hypothetical protein